MIMWDPATYPDVKNFADIGKTDMLSALLQQRGVHGLLHVSGRHPEGQVDGSYDGTPALFVADQGKSAQQGFGSAEPYIYQNEVKEWGSRSSTSYINDNGWNNYAESIATKPENITKYADCFKKLVPIIQQASVDYLKTRPLPTRSSSTPLPSSTTAGCTARAWPTTPSRRSRPTAWWATVPTRRWATSTTTRVNELIEHGDPGLHGPRDSLPRPV